MIQIAGDFKFPGWSGLIQSLQNSTTLRASLSGNIIVGSPHSLRPEIDNAQTLGVDFLRWSDLFSVNGTFTNRPTAGGNAVALLTDIDENGLRPVDARQVSGHIIPDTPDMWVFGTATNKFGEMNAESGIFDFTNLGICDAGTITINDFLIVGSAATFDLQGTTLITGPVTLANNLFAPLVAHTRGIGTPSLPFAAMYAGSGLFSHVVSTNRPEFSNVLLGNSGSGLALRNENIWYDHLRGNTEAIEISTLTLSMDGLTTRPYGVPIADANSVVLADHFNIVTHRGSSALDPSDWYIYLRRTQSDGSIEATSGIVASGQFGWSASADTVQKTWGRWNTSGNIPAEFEPGSCYDVVIHNDGSGTAINSPVVRLSAGFRINAPASGQGA